MKQERSASTKRVKDLISIARKMGLRTLKVGDIEFELMLQSKLKDEFDNTPIINETKTEREPTEDELLLWSTGSYEDVRADRESK